MLLAVISETMSEIPQRENGFGKGPYGRFSLLVDRRRHQSYLNRLDELRLGHRGKFLLENLRTF